MKKHYMKPTMLVVNVQTQQMLASSPTDKFMLINNDDVLIENFE